MTPHSRDEQLLYAEYALGVLETSERARVERAVRDDPRVAALVEVWEGRLAPLNDDVQPVAPPDYIWHQLSKRLAVVPPIPTKRLVDRVPFWRALALGGWLTSGAAIVALIAVMVTRVDPGDPMKGPTALAALTQTGGSLQWTALFEPKERRLSLVPVPAIAIASDRSAELWLIPTGSAPISLGVVPVDRTVTVNLSQGVYDRIVNGSVLAVSLEPKGGSPTGAPTGKVISSGLLNVI